MSSFQAAGRDLGILTDPKEEERTTLSRSIRSIGYKKDYLEDTWFPPQAFREFIQNLTDGILMSYNLTRKDITHEIESSDHHFITKVIRRAQQHPNGIPLLLGWVRFDTGTGEIEITNCNAQLRPSFVDIGGSTKKKSNALAGGYGEGAKIAALILTREGYQVQYQSTSFNWKFYLGGPQGLHFFCSLTPIPDKELSKRRAQYETAFRQGLPRDMVANPWEDVTVRIGSIDRGKGMKVTMEEFREWIKVSLDLQSPSNVIETYAGSVIFDEDFSGKIYLKGLYLENYKSSKPFKYSYNFARGSVGRDREKTANAHQEACDLATIWAFGIEHDQDITLAKYVEMMRDHTEWADVNLVERYIPERTVKKIWEFLLSEDPAREVFYHDDRNGDMDVELIRRSLKKEPKQLPRRLWDPLRRCNVVRTPQEQRRHLLRNSKDSALEDTPFSIGVKHSLMAALTLDERTRDFKLRFKSSANAELVLLLEGSEILVNEKWLDFHSSHDGMPCWFSRRVSSKEVGTGSFFCNHVVNDLYEVVLAELRHGRPGAHNNLGQSHGSLRLRVSENLHQMPQMIEARPGNRPGEIEVSWADLQGSLTAKFDELNTDFRVILHRQSKCSDKRANLVGPKGGAEAAPQIKDTIGFAECGCPEQIVSQKDCNAIFSNLSHDEEYFPMVARTEPEAFFGISPKEIRPKAPEVIRSVITSGASNLGMLARALAAVRHRGPQRQISSENLGGGDTSNSDGDDLSGDSPTKRLSRQSSLSCFESSPTQSSSTSPATLPPQSSRPAQSRPAQEIAQLKIKKEYQQSELAPHDQELRELRSQLDTVNSTREQLTNDVANLRGENETLRMQLDEAVAALQTKDRQIFEASTANASQFLERQQRLEEAKSEIAALREKLEGMAKDLHVKEQQILDNTANASQLLERQQQLDEARSEIEAQREKLEAMATDLRSKDHQAHDAEAAIESLKAKEPDAIKLVNTLLNENTSLQEENRILGLQLAGAEKDVDQQLAWSLIRAERRRTAHPKRMRPSGEEDVVSLAEPSAKRPRQVVSGTVEDMAEDATNERLPSVDDALMLDGV